MSSSTGATVISLDAHPARRSRAQRDRALRDAMRRHPSFQGASALRLTNRAELAVVVPIGAR